MSKIEDRLAALGVALPAPKAPVANYVPFVRAGNLVHISGQDSIDSDGGIKGVVGVDVDLETAQAAVSVSSAQVKRNEAIVAQKQLKAPFAGTIGIPRVDSGQ